ncbi:MAG: hypothetical protein R2783_06785 [Gelidibacter sp.]
MKPGVCKEKQDLVERLGVFMEQKEQLAPVAARIFSYIILTGKVGTTFEDLVRDLCASKSTISTHLNHLADLKQIVYFTKPGDRKKYYTVNQDSILQSIDAMMESYDHPKEIAFGNQRNIKRTPIIQIPMESFKNLIFISMIITSNFLDEDYWKSGIDIKIKNHRKKH